MKLLRKASFRHVQIINFLRACCTAVVTYVTTALGVHKVAIVGLCYSAGYGLINYRGNCYGDFICYPCELFWGVWGGWFREKLIGVRADALAVSGEVKSLGIHPRKLGGKVT